MEINGEEVDVEKDIAKLVALGLIERVDEPTVEPLTTTT